MRTDRIPVYLADLTHTGPVLSSNVHPLAAGLIGAQLMKSLPGLVEVELFKYPQDLSAAVSRRAPRIAGFSNYSWNCNLAYEYALRLKKNFPDVIVVFGGPNYGLEPEEISAFWQHHPLIDFYVVKEGELAMVELVRALHHFNYDARALKESGARPPNCHYSWKGEMVLADVLPRIKDLGELPSPYLLGMMDKFFNQVLSPMVHTTRGCPFACTFCTEGADYYNKVAQRVDLQPELEYIAQRIGSVPDLYLSDANFGMFKDDVEKARVIAGIQEKYGWPKRIVTSTGKNQKERVIEVASMLDGALNIAASLQSTDQTVLENIKRSNISLDALSTMAERSGRTKADTFTEIILGLPGDTVARHINTLRDVIDADLGIIRMYQLIMLPQTELNTPATRLRYAMKTRHRIMPRSFGRYELMGEAFTAVESEEICVENNSLSFEDYVECREWDLSVEIVHNGSVFAELKGVCKWLDHSWFDFLRRFHNRRRSFNRLLSDLYDQFRAETTARLWESRESLERHVMENIDVLQTGNSSTNEMANAKVTAFFNLQDTLHDILFDEMEAVLVERGRADNIHRQYVQQLKKYSRCRKVNLIDHNQRLSALFNFDFESIAEQNYSVDPKCYVVDPAREYRFAHSASQAELIDGYVSQYGKTLDGLGRILMRVWPTKRLFREVSVDSTVIAGHVS
jgi:radical SAM superfamily enzyme YgiQ (UPF0313 family)